MLWTHQNKVLEDIKQKILESTDTLMTASWHAVAKLLTVSRMSKVNYRNKVLPKKVYFWFLFYVISVIIYLK